MASARVKIDIVLSGGYALSAIFVLSGVWVLTLGSPEWPIFVQWGGGLAVFFTVVWAALRAYLG